MATLAQFFLFMWYLVICVANWCSYVRQSSSSVSNLYHIYKEMFYSVFLLHLCYINGHIYISPHCRDINSQTRTLWGGDSIVCYFRQIYLWPDACCLMGVLLLAGWTQAFLTKQNVWNDNGIHVIIVEW